MAKGSVRKKGKKWYYRFYVENESGNLVQKEYAGTESKSETEALLRKAMEDYEAKKFVARSENVTVGDLLDMWIEEEVKPGNLSNGTVMAYQGAAGRIKQFPIGSRKLKSITSEHLPAVQPQRRYRGLRASIFINSVTHSQVICSRTGQRRRMCRSFWDTPTSVPP